MIRHAVALALVFCVAGTGFAQAKKTSVVEPDKKVESSEPTDNRTATKKKADADAAAGAVGIMIGMICFGAFVYLVPTMIAVMRGHANTGPIVIVNIILGWTMIGWVVALAWAFSNQDSGNRIAG